MQGDGNLVLYSLREGAWIARWSSGTEGTNVDECYVDPAGRLALRGAGIEQWHKGQGNDPSGELIVQNDENVVLYGDDGSLIWSTDTWMASPVRTTFDPAVHGFKFKNNFPDAYWGGIPTPGLCGGMSYSALDYFNASRTPPWQKETPSTGSLLGNYILNRQWDSLRDWVGSETQLGKLIALNANPDNAALRYWSTNDEWTKITASIDAGVPVPLGLEHESGSLSDSHQVVANGYQSGTQGEYVIFCYSPNDPGVEHVLRLSPGQRYWNRV